MPAKTFITRLSLIGVALLTMTACDAQTDKPIPQQINDLIARTKANLVFVEGGTFTMGDFGPQVDKVDHLPFTDSLDNKHLHEVTLDSFSLMAYRVTYEDYALYTASKGLPPVEETYAKTMVPELRTIANMPAGVSWDDANGYCQWLGEVTGLPMSLPTEAQWEYAARNRGQLVIYATDNGKYEEGRNFPSYEQRLVYTQNLEADTLAIVYPVGQFPPSPLGFYDMGFGGSEWMKDWYAADYYEHSPVSNPQGPGTGTEKVVRGASDSDRVSRMTVYRGRRLINDRSYWPYLIRCAVNSPQPVPH